MGLCINKDDTPHGITFEIRAMSVIFNDNDIYPEGWAEMDKRFLRKLAALLADPQWTEKLGIRRRSLDNPVQAGSIAQDQKRW